MKVYLPSHGILGQACVDLKQPTWSTLRDLRDYNQEEVLFKAKVVALLSDADLTKITYDDMCYLVHIAIFAVLLNRLEVDVNCGNPECKKHKDKETLHLSIQVSDLDIQELKLAKKDLPFTKRISLKKYSFTIPSAQDVIDCYNEAVYDENETETFTDLKVAKVLKLPLQEVKKLPVPVYMCALAFLQINYHGLVLRSRVKCPVCGEETEFSFNIQDSCLLYDNERLMHKYMDVAQYLSFSDFLKLTVTEYNTIIDYINGQTS